MALVLAVGQGEPNEEARSLLAGGGGRCKQEPATCREQAKMYNLSTAVISILNAIVTTDLVMRKQSGRKVQDN